MLICNETILLQFQKHLSWATEIDIATAWATPNDGLNVLTSCSSHFQIRSVVGLWGNLTDPFALRELLRIGEVRTAQANRRFHSKVYIFRGDGKSIAWIGSANFTSGGFGRNEEALFETANTKSVQDWFNALWRQCDQLEPAVIDAYETNRIKNPPQSQPRPIKYVNQLPLRMFKQVSDWSSYINALEKCDSWWDRNNSWSVLGEQNSWMDTISILQRIAYHPDWNKLADYDRRRLLGLTNEENWALLGRMRHSARNTVFGDFQQEVQNIVHTVAHAEDDAFPQLAFQSYESLFAIHDVGQGIATRLLTLARPDRFVSLNSASCSALSGLFGLAKSTLGQPKNYARLLAKIYDQEWFKNPSPRNSQERAISSMRTALLDCFVYARQHD